MKRFLLIFVTVFCVFLCYGNVNALENDYSNYYIEEIYEDGSYLEVIIEENISTYSTSTKSGSKTTNYKDTSGNILWSVKISGTFTYTGSSATCTSSSITTTCPNSLWKLSNKKATKSGATASASVTAKEYSALGICLKTINKTVKLTCDKNGKLS